MGSNRCDVDVIYHSNCQLIGTGLNRTVSYIGQEVQNESGTFWRSWRTKSAESDSKLSIIQQYYDAGNGSLCCTVDFFWGWEVWGFRRAMYKVSLI